MDRTSGTIPRASVDRSRPSSIDVRRSLDLLSMPSVDYRGHSGIESVLGPSHGADVSAVRASPASAADASSSRVSDERPRLRSIDFGRSAVAPVVVEPARAKPKPVSVEQIVVDVTSPDQITASSTVEEIFEILKTSPNGLTAREREHRSHVFGPNSIPETKVNPIIQFLMFMWNPLSWVMEIAAIVAIAVSNGCCPSGPPDWQDFVGIVILLIINSTIGFVEEYRAGNAVAALKNALAPQAKVKRDGEWIIVDSVEIVPGDIISVKLGDVVPADGRLIAGVNIKCDQAALTGESLPTSKERGSELFTGSTIKQGEAEVVVTGIGVNTFFGKAAHLVDSTHTQSHFEVVLRSIGNFCLVNIGTWVLILSVVEYAALKYQYRTGIDNILVLLIGGIPIAMPTVLSVTLAIGAHELAEKKAIVTRMTAIQELAGMSVLCSDKTGTLTLNQLTIKKEETKLYLDNISGDDAMIYAARASRLENQDAIDYAVVNSLSDVALARRGIEELDFLPFDPVSKRTQITFREIATNRLRRISKGAPHVMIELCHATLGEAELDLVHEQITEMASRGYRSLIVAESVEVVEENAEERDPKKRVDLAKVKFGDWNLVSLLPIFDPPRHDTRETIQKALALGVTVKMLTGDDIAIAKETARQLGMGSNIFPARELTSAQSNALMTQQVEDLIQSADGFAGVFPEHKYEIVNRLQKMGCIVGMTGDGVNDAPALKVSNIGIAVADATDAARAAADIVLVEPGLSVIIDAIIGSRRIFQRMKNYATYACSSTVSIVVRFTLLVFLFEFDMPPFMILIIAYLNDGTIMTISTDRVKASEKPDQWALKEIFIIATVLGLYLSLSTIIFIYSVYKTPFWLDHFPQLHEVDLLNHDFKSLANSDPVNRPVFHSIVYLQVSILSQALIFVTRSRGFCYFERPSVLLCLSFVIAQLVATLIAVYADWSFTHIQGCGWSWALAVWVWNLVWFVPLDFIKIAVRYWLDGKVSFMTVRRPMSFDISLGRNNKTLGRSSADAQRARSAAVSPHGAV